LPKFAHMSDVHIGAFRSPELKGLVLKAFDIAIDRCVEEGVEFVIIAGDIFDSNIPDLASVRRAAARIHEAKEKGIRFYVVYGSHDYSPNFSSIVDVLESAGLLTKIEKVTRTEDGKIELAFTEDPSGVKLCGISGKKLGLDRFDYEQLDTERLEKERGFKIFVFHGALEELKPASLPMMEAMSISKLPKGFDYYAGGHIHERSVRSVDGFRNIAYPGPLFGTDFRDLEATAKGARTGFYMVEFDTEVKEVHFVEVNPCPVVELEYSAEGKSSIAAWKDLHELTRSADVEGKVVLLKVHGKLSEGKTSDIDFGALRRQLAARRPISLLLNYNQLTSQEQAVFAQQASQTPSMTEKEIFERRIASVSSRDPKLRGESGVSLSLALLNALKEEKKENELKSAYESRIEKAGADILELEKSR
jgi:exonuclease SbcD